MIIYLFILIREMKGGLAQEKKEILNLVDWDLSQNCKPKSNFILIIAKGFY